MREISTEKVKVGEHVLIDGVEYVAEKEDLRNPCKGCALYNYSESCSALIDCDGIIFVKVEKEPKYRPYKDTDEMIADWKERYRKNWSKTSMPLIWIWDKHEGERTLVTGFGRQAVYTTDVIIHMASLLQSYTYLDGTPCGKEVTE